MERGSRRGGRAIRSIRKSSIVSSRLIRVWLPQKDRLLLRISVSRRRLVGALLLIVLRLGDVTVVQVSLRRGERLRIRTAGVVAAASAVRTAVVAMTVGDRRIVIVAARATSATASGKTCKAEQTGKNERVPQHGSSVVDKNSLTLATCIAHCRADTATLHQPSVDLRRKMSEFAATVPIVTTPAKPALPAIP